MSTLEKVEQLKSQAGTIADAHSCIFHYTFNSKTGAPFERVTEQDLLVGDIVKVLVDGSAEIEHFIVTTREPVLVLADDGDVLVTFITLDECIPNTERTDK